MSWVRREQDRARQAAVCVCGVRLGFLAQLFSFHGGGKEVGVYHHPKPLTIEQANCFKMVFPTFGCAFN